MFLSLSNVRRDRFERSQWCPKDRVSTWYVLYRVLLPLSLCIGIALAMFFSMGVTQAKWLIYLTNQGLVFLTIHFILEAFIVVDRYRRDRRKDLSSVLEGKNELPLLYKISWALGSCFFSMAMIISLIYWILIHRHIVDRYTTFAHHGLNFLLHGANTLVCVFDMFVSNRPWRFSHFFFSFCYGTSYTGFTGVYYLLGGKGMCNEHNECTDFIYPFLDWSKSYIFPWLMTSVFVVTGIIIHSFWMLLFRLRLLLHRVVVGHDELEEGVDHGQEGEGLASGMGTREPRLRFRGSLSPY